MWAQLGLTGLSALSGLLGGRSQTSTNESNTNASGSQSQSGSSRRFLTPEQLAAMQLLSTFSAGQLSDPAAGLDSVLQTQRNKVNSAYSGVSQKIADTTLAHGGSSSGKYLRGVRGAEMGRLSALQDVDAQLPGLVMSREQQAAQQLLAILGMSMGSDETGSSSFNQTSSTKGKQVGPSNMLGGLAGGAGGMAGYLYGAGKW